MTTGGRATPSWGSTPPTATTWWSAARCASWSTSSETWRERGRQADGAGTERAEAGVLRIFPPEEGATRIVLVRHGEAECNLNRVIGGPKGCTGLTDSGARPGGGAGRPALRERRAAPGDGPVLLGAAPGHRDGRASPARGGVRARRRSARCGSAATCASSIPATPTAWSGPRWSRPSRCPTGTRTPPCPSRRAARAGRSSWSGPRAPCGTWCDSTRVSWWWRPSTPG